MKVLILLKSCFFVPLLVCVTNSQSQRGTIQTSSGWIKGSVLSFHGRRVYQYLGIPYAQPPLGDLRFKKPQPIRPWSGILKANREPTACIQYAVYPFPWYDFQKGKSEDCLYLNIWAPETRLENLLNRKKKSVMFWIHGGGYSYGSGRKPIYDGRALAAEGDVVVVTINYRLGAFGFFTTNTDAAPVNNALFDMLEALKWVHKNIYLFGGDPNQVTVFGQSAGSWSTGLFCVSPLTKGLFHRAIMESGSHAYIPFDDNTTSIMLSQRLAGDLGCADAQDDIITSPDKVADCMRTKDAMEIAKTLNSYNPNLGLVYNFVYGNEFLPDNAREDLILGNFHNVSVLIGTNRDEGSFLLTLSYPEIFGFFGKKSQNFNASVNLFKSILNNTLEVVSDNPDTDNVTQTVLGRLSTDDYEKNRKIIYDFMGDFLLVCPTVYFAESYSRYGKDVYFYFFEHRPSRTPWAKWMGITHYEEVQFVFGSPVKEGKNYTHEEVKLSKLMIKMWSNFAKYGYPLDDESNHLIPRGAGLHQSDQNSEQWPIYSREEPLYLKLDTTTLKTKRYKIGPHKANCDLLRPIHGFA